VQGIQQEASVEYWVRLLADRSLSVSKTEFCLNQCSILLLDEIEAIKRILKERSEYEKYLGIDSDGESWGYFFESEIFYKDEEANFKFIFSSYERLIDLQTTSNKKAKTLTEVALFCKDYDYYGIAKEYLERSFIYENKLATLLENLSLPSDDSDKFIVLTAIIENYPEHHSAYLSRGFLKENRKDYKGALSDFSAYIEFCASNADAYVSRGRIRYYLGDRKGMMEDVNRAVQLGSCLGYCDKFWLNPPHNPSESDPPF